MNVLLKDLIKLGVFIGVIVALFAYVGWDLTQQLGIHELSCEELKEYAKNASITAHKTHAVAHYMTDCEWR